MLHFTCSGCIEKHMEGWRGGLQNVWLCHRAGRVPAQTQHSTVVFLHWKAKVTSWKCLAADRLQHLDLLWPRKTAFMASLSFILSSMLTNRVQSKQYKKPLAAALESWGGNLFSTLFVWWINNHSTPSSVMMELVVRANDSTWFHLYGGRECQTVNSEASHWVCSAIHLCTLFFFTCTINSILTQFFCQTWIAIVKSEPCLALSQRHNQGHVIPGSKTSFISQKDRFMTLASATKGEATVQLDVCIASWSIKTHARSWDSPPTAATCWCRCCWWC